MNTATSTPTVLLRPGVAVPQIGMGTYQVHSLDHVVRTALNLGYRLFDLADSYGNEPEFGEVLQHSPVPRDAVFLTSKVANHHHGRDLALRAFDKSAAALRVQIIDLYLVHWPVPSQDLYVQTYQALEQLQDEGRVRAIGVSNFGTVHLTRLLDAGARVPAVNQIELHPYFQQPTLRDLHDRLGIVTQAWSPLGRGAVLHDPVIIEIAASHHVSPAQVILRWHLQLGNVVVPKASSHERLAANMDLFGFELTPSEMARVQALDRGTRGGPDPETM